MILIGLGANITGRWGAPDAALAKARTRLEACGVKALAFSPLYLTAPLGPAQPAYHNAAAIVRTALPALSLLRVLKRLEAEAGRRSGARWGPRPLDLDILDYHGVRQNWRGGKCAPRPAIGRALILPHAQMHLRPFVLKPVSDIAPLWHHPLLGLTAAQLLRRIMNAGEGAVIQQLPQQG